jgi:hypothetical protein
MLETQVSAQARIVGVGYIPGGEHVGVTGGQVVIDDDTVIDR